MISPDNYYIFKGIDCIKEYVNFLINLDYKTHIYAHNGTKFDYIFLLKEYIQRSTNIHIVNRGNDIIFLSTKGNTVKFMDSYRIIQGSLKDIAKSFNIELAKTASFHIIYPNIDLNNITNEMVSYCYDDTLALFKIINQFETLLNRYGLSLSIGSTVSSLAYKGFSYLSFKRLYENDIVVNSLNESNHRFMYKNYRGGMVDNLKRLMVTKAFDSMKSNNNLLFNRFVELINSYKDSVVFQNINHIDISSSYPTSMMDAYPVGDPVVTMGDNIKIERPGFYEVIIEILPEAKGLLYLKDYDGKGNIFVKCGEFKTVLTQEEIAYFTSIGEIRIKKVIKSVTYEKEFQIFSD
ncbi:MAG: hypothetical protein GY738_30790 [Pseudoalteromonas sp.]|nr:hypothetical protein [Pseudoalteromonas sp.]